MHSLTPRDGGIPMPRMHRIFQIRFLWAVLGGVALPRRRRIRPDGLRRALTEYGGTSRPLEPAAFPVFSDAYAAACPSLRVRRTGISLAMHRRSHASAHAQTAKSLAPHGLGALQVRISTHSRGRRPRKEMSLEKEISRP